MHALSLPKLSSENRLSEQISERLLELVGASQGSFQFQPHSRSLVFFVRFGVLRAEKRAEFPREASTLIVKI